MQENPDMSAKCADWGSVTRAIHELGKPDRREGAATKLFERFHAAAKRQAAIYLQRTPLGLTSAEDIASTAFTGLLLAIVCGRLAVHDREEFQRFLATALRRDAINAIEHETAQKRDQRRKTSLEHTDHLPQYDAPDLILSARETAERLWSQLNPNMQEILLQLLLGFTPSQIVDPSKKGRSQATITRTLRYARDIFNEQLSGEPDDFKIILMNALLEIIPQPDLTTRVS